MLSSPIYQNIQNWICQQQEYEAAHSTPAPLTEAQQKALRALQLALPQATAPQADVDIGDTNWVGILQEFRASRPKMSSSTTGLAYKEWSSTNLSLTWSCHVLIDEHAEPFPGPAGGLLSDGTLPSFTRKKDAKQYAAKCAVEWLRENGLMPQDGIRFPKAQRAAPLPLSISSKKQKMCPPSPEQPKTPAPKTGKSEGSPNGVVPGSSPSPFNEDERSAAFEVSQLWAELGFYPFQYIIEPVPDSPGFFSGHPDFGMQPERFPENFGHVEKVYSRRAAKEKIAEEMLKYLRQLDADRDRGIQQFMQSLGRGSLQAVKGDSSAPV
ncbi:hypothetical protein F5B20DRAFT_229471 [Whalleya microplaca]|nr:hypothetical protein F5B20DRAFT_229471 [Whalleya microplaca]